MATKAEEEGKRSAAMHQYQADYAAWKLSGPIDPSTGRRNGELPPTRPSWSEIDAERAA